MKANLMQPKLFKSGFIKSAISVAMLAGIVWAAGCKVEVLPTREQQKLADEKKKVQEELTAVAPAPVPSTDNAAQVIAACGSAASDEVVSINDKHDSGSVRHLVYRNGPREVTLDFIPQQTNSNNGHAATSSNTVWRFNEARVDDQRLLTAANIKIYLPCAANALAKEF